jgi:hypothetical protein
VTGKAVRVTHVVRGGVQRIGLDVACQYNDPEAEKSRQEHSKRS